MKVSRLLAAFFVLLSSLSAQISQNGGSGGGNSYLWTRVGTVIYPRADLAIDQQAVQEVSVMYDTSGNCPVIGSGYGTGCWRAWFHCGWSTNNICAAESTDAFTWQRSAGAVGGLTANSYATPFVWKAGTTYYFLGSRTSGNLDEWTSTDGFNWANPSASILTPGSAGTWDSSSLGNTSVVTFGPVAGMWYMLYDAVGTGCLKNCIGTATSTNNGVSWTKGGSNPVMTGGTLGGIGGPDLHYANGQWYAYMHTGQLPSDIYFSTSTDFVNWTTPTLVLRRQTPDEGVSIGTGSQAQISDPFVMEAPCIAFWPNANTPVLYNSTNKCSFMFYEAIVFQSSPNDSHIKLAVANMPLAQTLAAQQASAANLGVELGGQPFVQEIYDVPTTSSAGKLFGVTPDYWMTRTSANTDVAGELAFSSATIATYSWVGKYSNHPECGATPQFDLGATPPRMWITYSTTVSFTINFSAAVTGSVSYHCDGRN
ncbi:MAG TPA: hypothetical protein VMQ17_08820 [Candidatus Sulfotelmatobacter sp.]|nr:hypothetical protein [Candidatus Sulfotelmatobacter sp.]